MCELYTELVVHQLKIHELAIQNVSKVSEVMSLQSLEALFDSSDSDSKYEIPFEDEPADDLIVIKGIGSTYGCLENDWSADDTNSNRFSDANGNQCDDDLRANRTQTNDVKKCYKCNKTFKTFGTLCGHMTRLHGMARTDAQEYVAFQREEKAPRKSSLYNNPVACRECNITFVRPTTLRTHYVRVHQMNAEESYRLLPKRIRREPNEIRAVDKDDHDSDSIRTISTVECYSCSKCFDRVPGLLEHFYRVHEPAMPVECKKRSSKPIGNGFACNICKKTYLIRHKLQAHMIAVHGLTESEAWTQTEPVKSTAADAARQLLFVCEICQSGRSKCHALRQHIIRAHALSAAEAWNLCKVAEPLLCPRAQFVQQWICYVCKKSLAKKCSVRIHLERFHPIENSMSTIKIKKVLRPGSKECHICHKTFRFDFSLQDHLKRSHNPKQSHATSAKKLARLFPCTHCEMVFKRAWKLVEHIKSLKQGKSIMCRKCYAGFDNRADLTQHMKRNERCKKIPMAKTALCTYCGESFVNKWALDVHTRRHLNIRPFECDKCDLKFFTRLQLQRHQPAHVTERQWFVCPVDGCGKNYSQLSYLKYHEKQKHSEPTLKCPHCDEMFTTERYRTYVNQHINFWSHSAQMGQFSISQRSCARSYWRETTQMWYLLQGVRTKIIDLRSSTHAHQSTPIQMRYLSEGNLHSHTRPIVLYYRDDDWNCILNFRRDSTKRPHLIIINDVSESADRRRFGQRLKMNVCGIRREMIDYSWLKSSITLQSSFQNKKKMENNKNREWKTNSVCNLIIVWKNVTRVSCMVREKMRRCVKLAGLPIKQWFAIGKCEGFLNELNERCDHRSTGTRIQLKRTINSNVNRIFIKTRKIER